MYGAGRLSTSLTLSLNNRLYNTLHFIDHNASRLGIVLLFGFGLNIFNLLTVFIVSVLDYRREKALGRTGKQDRQFKLKDIKLSILLLASHRLSSKSNFNTPMANLVNTGIVAVAVVA